MLHGTGTFEIDPPDRATMEARHSQFVAAGYPYLVAVSGGDVVGYAYGGPFRERKAFRFTVETSIYVRRDTHGRGVGGALLAALVAEATTRGFRQMVAVIGDSANAGSIALHAKAGFAPAGVLKGFGWKHGRWLDCVLMQRTIGDGATCPANEA